MRDRKATPEDRQGFEDLCWAQTAREVQQHVGQLVAVCRKRVVAVGVDEAVLLQQALAEGCAAEEVVFVVVPRLDFQELPN